VGPASLAGLPGACHAPAHSPPLLHLCSCSRSRALPPQFCSSLFRGVVGASPSQHTPCFASSPPPPFNPTPPLMARLGGRQVCLDALPSVATPFFWPGGGACVYLHPNVRGLRGGSDGSDPVAGYLSHTAHLFTNRGASTARLRQRLWTPARPASCKQVAGTLSWYVGQHPKPLPPPSPPPHTHTHSTFGSLWNLARGCSW
jgi:hypothetical protein